jgi:methionyl-tRNA formyltransferase
MMRIIIITSSRRGTASYCLPLILEKSNCEVVKVVLNENITKKKWSFYQNKLKKIWRIGILGALNGIRIRKWFRNDESVELRIQDIEAICKERGILFEKTPFLNSQTTIDLVKNCEPDLGLSLGNSYISPKVFSIPRHGMLNIHGEVLPDFQNAQSVIWQIFEGRPETGYTIHKIDKRIDTGDIIMQEKFPIEFKKDLPDTVRFNCGLILQRAALGLVKVLNDYNYYLQRSYKQGKGKSYTTPTFSQYLRIKQQFKKLAAISSNKD